MNVEIGARPQFLRHEIGGAGAHAFLDVVAGDDEVLAVVSPSPQDDMDMRVVGVPVIDADPVELRAQVLLHLPHQLAGVILQIGHVHRVFGRDDEAEMVPVVGAAFLEGVEVGGIGLRPVGLARLAVAAHAVALHPGFDAHGRTRRPPACPRRSCGC